MQICPLTIKFVNLQPSTPVFIGFKIVVLKIIYFFKKTKFAVHVVYPSEAPKKKKSFYFVFILIYTDVVHPIQQNHLISI